MQSCRTKTSGWTYLVVVVINDTYSIVQTCLHKVTMTKEKNIIDLLFEFDCKIYSASTDSVTLSDIEIVKSEAAINNVRCSTYILSNMNSHSGQALVNDLASRVKQILFFKNCEAVVNTTLEAYLRTTITTNTTNNVQAIFFDSKEVLNRIFRDKNSVFYHADYQLDLFINNSEKFNESP